MRDTNKRAKGAILIVVAGAVIGWVLFTLGNFSDLMLSRAAEDSPAIAPSRYSFVVAIAIFGLGALLAKKQAVRLRARTEPVGPLATSAHLFANTALIISLILAVWAAISVFFTGFFGSTFSFSVPQSAGIRFLDL